MKELIRYMADDGRVFNSRTECEEYERKGDVEKLKDYIWFFNSKGEPITADRLGGARFCKLIKPYDDSWPEDVLRTWERCMDCELDDAMCNCGMGWYFLDDYDRWQYWDDYNAEYILAKSQLDNVRSKYDN
jgi:hypothetical protein